jgi:predicted phosphohydrolase
MKIAAISDTHGLHHQLIIPQADMLLHSGDVSVKGTEAEILDFLDWFSQQRHKHKVFIAGNHDFFFEGKSKKELNKIIPENIHYLNNELLEIEGLKIWGSPHTPKPKKRWAFNRERGQDIQKEWDQIPENLDILIVH